MGEGRGEGQSLIWMEYWSKRMKKFEMLAVILAVFTGQAAAQENKAQAAAKPLYENNFEKAAVNSVPEEMLVLDGAFAVKQEGDNKFLELPGAPLDTFGALFGPTEKEGLAVSARVFGTGKGRRFPTFGVGLNGVNGYKLQVSASKKSIELFRGEEVKASVPYEWESGKWTHLRLQIRKTKDGEWSVSGKVWVAGSAEPARPAIEAVEKEEPLPGRSSIWGSPYSGTPIGFDDLRVAPASGQP
jgi:hypothetical protein